MGSKDLVDASSRWREVARRKRALGSKAGEGLGGL